MRLEHIKHIGLFQNFRKYIKVTLIGTVLMLEHINTFLVCCKILGLDINVLLLQKNVEKIKMSQFFSLLKDLAGVADLGSDFFPSQMRMRSKLFTILLTG
jgi:hypothetical protein